MVELYSIKNKKIKLTHNLGIITFPSSKLEKTGDLLADIIIKESEKLWGATSSFQWKVVQIVSGGSL